jgi:glycosyltransferase involved in cell wall biosynthesis
MKIIVSTGIYPPHVGGPAEYAFHITEELRSRGHTVTVLTYGVERKLPILVRHMYFFFRVMRYAFGADFILALDTLSVGIPSAWAARIVHIPLLTRIGGDFLWESYIERTGEKIQLSHFYDKLPALNFKERLIFRLTKSFMRHVDVCMFNTEWQMKIWEKPYMTERTKPILLDNYYPEREASVAPSRMNFMWTVRPIKFKNGDALERVWKRFSAEYPDAVLDTERVPHDELMKKIQSCYAIILPSISDICPNLIIDGLRFGKPFICTADSGIWKRVSGLGIPVDPLDDNSIYEALKQMADPDIYAQYCARIQASTNSHSWKDIVDEILGAYNSLKQRENN